IVDLPGVMGRALLSLNVDWAYLDNLWAILWPMIVGSIPTFVLVWLAFYLILKPLVATYQVKRIARRRRKQDKLRAAALQETVEADMSEEYDSVETLPAGNSQVAKEANG
ncbi:MAG: hypothetical protein KAJ11_04280, partial [Alphaproteobacteria bacterium]|nr:hypothetical protein [Alphaproteobacteria bacterium]